MPSTHSLLANLRVEYPQFNFHESDCFRWSPDTQSLYFEADSPDFSFFVLHELGHALLGHTTYRRDIDLLKIERDAWIYACVHLAGKYDVVIDEDLIQDNLDTYRDWLHSRSRCPACTMIGLQTGKDTYSCLACGCRWKSNEARHCALRRYTISP